MFPTPSWALGNKKKKKADIFPALKSARGFVSLFGQQKISALLLLGKLNLKKKEKTSSGFPGKESAWDEGDLGLILGSGRAPEEGNGYQLQYSCLENSMNRGA